MNRLLLVAALAMLTACTPAGILATEKPLAVDIDGIPHLVQKMPGSSTGWAASRQDIYTVRFVDPNDYILNVRAIEKVTGCKVIKDTISNQGMRTQAAVHCGAGS